MADLYYDLRGNDSAGVPGVGILTVQATLDLTLTGSLINQLIPVNLLQIESQLFFNLDVGLVIDVSSIDLKLIVETDIRFVNVDQGTVGPALVKWSNIGSIDFTIGKDNIAGECSLDWFGYVFDIRKLGNKVVVYGINGISFLLPAGNAFGLETIYRVGIKGRRAVTGDNTKHFFIDKIGQLWRIDESLNKLDYSEYLSLMSSSLVMTYDYVNNLIYICDGVYGFVYNHSNGSFGAGPVDITGFGYKNGYAYISSSGDLSIPSFEICTGIYDLGTNFAKVLTELEFAVDTDKTLQALIEYRDNIDDEFSSTSWKTLSDNGKVVIPCYGREFKVRLKCDEYDDFKLEHINVYGNLNVIGELPINWKTVKCVKKLNASVILYCDNGVFSFDGENLLSLYNLPVLNKTCIAGNELSHFFIDSKNKLFKLSNNLELLDYSEFLTGLSNPSMVYDEDSSFVYICDGSNGYVYCDNSKSFGKYYGNLTGFYSSFNTTYVGKADNVLFTLPEFEICTDIYDLGNRKLKTIHAIEIGTDVNIGLLASVEFRQNHKAEFTQMPWFPVTMDGISYINCSGTEFRFKIKSVGHMYFEIDYLKILGTIHSYSISDDFKNPTF